jgi:hypothetical protein
MSCPGPFGAASRGVGRYWRQFATRPLSRSFASLTAAQSKLLGSSLKENDPDLYTILKRVSAVLGADAVVLRPFHKASVKD